MSIAQFTFHVQRCSTVLFLYSLFNIWLFSYLNIFIKYGCFLHFPPRHLFCLSDAVYIISYLRFPYRPSDYELLFKRIVEAADNLLPECGTEYIRIHFWASTMAMLKLIRALVAHTMDGSGSFPFLFLFHLLLILSAQISSDQLPYWGQNYLPKIT